MRVFLERLHRRIQLAQVPKLHHAIVATARNKPGAKKNAQTRQHWQGCGRGITPIVPGDTPPCFTTVTATCELLCAKRAAPNGPRMQTRATKKALPPYRGLLGL